MGKEDAADMPRRHLVGVIHWRHLMLTAIRELGQRETMSESSQAIASKIRAHEPFAVGAALSNTCHEETNEYKRRENQSVEQ